MNGYRYRGNDTRYQVRVDVAPPIPDPPGQSLKPDPATLGTPAEFMDALRWLRTWAGEPSLRELARRCGNRPTHSAFQKMLRSDELPPLDLLTVCIEALGLSADRDAWCTAWRRLHLAGKGGAR